MIRINHKSSRGFTLIELLLYVAIISLFIGAAVVFAWNVVYGRVKSTTQQEVNQNLRLAGKRIMYELRNASAVNSVGASDVCLANIDPARNPTKLYVVSNRLRIAWGGGSSDCTGMTNDEPLTSSAVAVSSLTFTDLSSGTESTNVKYSLAIDSTGDRQEWQMSKVYTASTEVRSLQAPKEAAPGTGAVEVKVSASSDDAEEEVSTGLVSLGSSDLELVYDSSANLGAGDLQVVGIRFTGVGIQPGAIITKGYIQFLSKDDGPLTAMTLQIEGEANDNAPVFDNNNLNISSRQPRTTPVPWNLSALEWGSGDFPQTPDISSIIQEIVERPGWSIGNALVVIITGTDTSNLVNAASYDGDATNAPFLHVEYYTP